MPQRAAAIVHQLPQQPRWQNSASMLVVVVDCEAEAQMPTLTQLRRHTHQGQKTVDCTKLGRNATAAARSPSVVAVLGHMQWGSWGVSRILDGVLDGLGSFCYGRYRLIFALYCAFFPRLFSHQLLIRTLAMGPHCLRRGKHGVSSPVDDRAAQ